VILQGEARELDPKLHVPPERSERRGPERCSGTFRTAEPGEPAGIARYRN
jgi:hypothetical protein